MRAVVDHSVQARLITVPSVTREVTVGLRYDRHDPFAVSLVFPSDVSLDGQEVVWVFSRELLEDGLRAAVGLGDVHIRPSGPERTVIELRAPEGVAVIEFDTTGLLRFLHGTYGVVPDGSEHLELDLDRGLTSLLG
ncbi:SsgA family sporulation/cell division regulator [Streptomyces radiopugnans]|uniref:Streptomyces sporulation and cell division protein, SsgA n=1 Tax=Streptomyces radiopugnans TaxID=403935 RepID=A0A1H9H194_9ACTN|nr:SsgA family sporulation/cell division regulator [Streptomyces radiopugnans]URN12210.1 SsgA family sporulation/cell division regulator [Streptomyces radiopugnans]SEQ56105.1 Streptomyces sporulation and cell division protein, SsgA [Streptomyces radiopugnans]